MSKRPDVAIVGGGVIGLSCAWRLAQGGARVTLLERGALGAEASWAAGGMLAPSPEALVHSPDCDENARAAMLQLGLESRDSYAGFAAELLEHSGVDVELSLASSATSDWREPGILLCDSRVAQAPPQSQARPWNDERAWWLPDDGQVEPRYLTDALRIACERAGVTIREQTPVRRFAMNGDRVGALLLDEERLEAEQFLLCAGAWSGQDLGLPVHATPPVRPVAGQMLQLRGQRRLRHVVYGANCYLVPRRDGRLLVGATVEEVGFAKRVTTSGTLQLLHAASELIPRLGGLPLDASWAGLRPTAPDGLPIVGGGPIDNLSYATGHGRNGILLAPRTAEWIVGQMLRGQIVPEAFGFGRDSSR